MQAAVLLCIASECTYDVISILTVPNLSIRDTLSSMFLFATLAVLHMRRSPTAYGARRKPSFNNKPWNNRDLLLQVIGSI